MIDSTLEPGALSYGECLVPGREADEVIVTKHGRFLPGTHIPVFPPGKIFETRPDYVLILPWNVRDEIMAQMAAIREWGGQFVVPIPDVKIYP